jgi:hypothetical protein
MKVGKDNWTSFTAIENGLTNSLRIKFRISTHFTSHFENSNFAIPLLINMQNTRNAYHTCHPFECRVTIKV